MAEKIEDDLQFVTKLLQHFSNQQVVGRMCVGMLLTVIDVTGRAFLHNSWAYFKNCREFDVATEQNGRTVRNFQLNGRDGGGRRSQIIEVECLLLTGAAGLGCGFSRLGDL